MRARDAAVEISARVRAAEVRFDETPEVELRAHPAPEHESERTNLPARVARATTYKRVEVRWRLGARLEQRREV